MESSDPRELLRAEVLAADPEDLKRAMAHALLPDQGRAGKGVMDWVRCVVGWVVDKRIQDRVLRGETGEYEFVGELLFTGEDRAADVWLNPEGFLFVVDVEKAADPDMPLFDPYTGQRIRLPEPDKDRVIATVG